MKVVLTRSMLPGDVRYIREGLDREIAGRYELVVPDDFSEEALVPLVGDADVLLGPYVTPRLLAAASKLRLIQVPWTGMDTFDFDAVRGRDVVVCNTHSNADAVAELAVALLLDLLKKVSYHDRKMRSGSWNREQHPLGLASGMLRGSAVCVLGYGSIGSRIGTLTSAFGAKVIAVDDNPKGSADAVFPTRRTTVALREADVVVCTVPLTSSTCGLISSKAISCMRNGALLLNVSRALLVDENSVWEALQSGKLAGFAADVWWKAPVRGESQSWPSASHPFHELENVVLSPHRAGFVEGSLPHLDGAVKNVIALEFGRPLTSIVGTEKGF